MGRDLGWEVDRSDEAYIKRMIEQGHATLADTTTPHGTLVWRTEVAIRHPENGRRMLFQAVPETKTVKNRIHLDLRGLEPGHLEAKREALESRGATFLHHAQQGPERWITMADPEGNEFCVG